MIFLTVGSELAFSRLVKAADEWALNNGDTRIIAQIGKTSQADYTPKHMDFVAVLSPNDFSDHCNNADLIIAHAGMGSIITALTTKKPIVILPRLEKHRETRNDHQIATAQQFSTREGVFAALTEKDIPMKIDEARAFAKQLKMGAFDQFAPDDFLKKISSFIHSSP